MSSNKKNIQNEISKFQGKVCSFWANVWKWINSYDVIRPKVLEQLINKTLTHYWGGPFFPPMQTYPSPTFSPPRGSTRQNLWPKWKYASQYHLPVVLNHITFQAVKCFQSSCLDKNFFRFKRRKEEYQKIVNIGSVVFNEYVVLVLWCWNKSNAAVFVTVTKVVTNCQIE